MDEKNELLYKTLSIEQHRFLTAAILDKVADCVDKGEVKFPKEIVVEGFTTKGVKWKLTLEPIDE